MMRASSNASSLSESRAAMPQTRAPGVSSGTSVTTEPGASGVPLWSVLAWHHTRR